MITTYETELGQCVKAVELYDYLGLQKGNYSRFIKKELLDNPYADSKSYSSLMMSEIRHGRFRQDYYIHIDFAKKLCMVSRSAKGEQIRNELVQLTKKVESLDLLNEDQILFLVQLKEVFKYVVNCETATEMHMSNYVNSRQPASKNLYAEFHTMRNKMLDLGKEQLEKRVREYCVEHQAKVPVKNKTQMLFLLDRYEILRNGIWDYLMANNHEQSMKLANLAMKMARMEGAPVQKNNDETLFRMPERNVEIGDIKKIEA